MRYVIVDVLLFLLPFAAFFAFAWWANPRRVGAGKDPLNTPWFWLWVAALVLAIGGFLVMRFVIDAHTGTYIPATVGPDGKLIPGHFEGADDQPPHIGEPHSPPPEPPPPPVPPPPEHP
jgi:hypothetical protein